MPATGQWQCGCTSKHISSSETVARAHVIHLPSQGRCCCPFCLPEMPCQMPLPFKRTRGTVLAGLLNNSMFEVRAHLFGDFPTRVYPVSNLSLLPVGHLMRATAFLCVSDLGQLIHFLFPRRGQNTVGQHMVHCDHQASCPFPDLIPHFSSPKWVVLNFPVVLFSIVPYTK